MEEVNLKYGRRIYDNQQLQNMKGYHSFDDENALNTHNMGFSISDNNFHLLFYEYDEHLEYLSLDPIKDIKNVPEGIKFNIHDHEEFRIWSIYIPLHLIESVILNSSVLNLYGDDSMPGEYYCHIELLDGKKIKVNGEFRGSEPDYWVYEHEVICEPVVRN